MRVDKNIKWIGKWDCEFCGTHGIDAIVMGSDGKPIRQLSCPNCGASVPKHGKNGGSPFYLPKNPERLDRKYSHAFGVPNWRCSSCDSENPDIPEVKRCLKCGNPKENTDSKRNKVMTGSKEKVIRDADEFESEEELITGITVKEQKEKAKAILENEVKPQIEKYEKKHHANITDPDDLEIYESSSNYNELFEEKPKEHKEKFEKRKLSTRKLSLRINWKPVIILFSVLTVAFFTWFLFIDDVEKFGTIDDKEWVRQIYVQDWAERHREAWEGEVPSGGTVYNRYEDIHHYDRVLDHYETRSEPIYTTEEYQSGTQDNGDGTFSPVYSTRQVQSGTRTWEEAVYRDDPVYATKCKYTIMDWEHLKTEKTSGSYKSKTVNPYWWSGLKDNERESKRKQRYTILMISKDGKDYQKAMKYNEWKKRDVGTKVTIVTNRVGYVKEIIY